MDFWYGYSWDIEVYSYDWFVDFFDDKNHIHHTFHNDYDGVIDFMEYCDLMYSFNGKHYDRYIFNAILNRKSPEWIKALNDDIIQNGMNGYESEYGRGLYSHYQFYDLMDDTQEGLSLKSFEAHMGFPIVECEVDFNLQRALTREECEQVIKYLHKDTENTALLCKERKNYLDTKISIGKKCGLTPAESLYRTNANLTATYLKAKKKVFDDEREYIFPKNIEYEYIPNEVLNFFQRISDPSVSDYDLFYNPKSNSFEFYIGECKIKVAWGGIHGAIEGYREEETESREILNKDGDSFYPNIDRVYKYTSRCMSNPEDYTTIIRERIEAKKSDKPEDKQKASDLKLIVNTTYGCKGCGKGGVGYNDLYDPLMMRSTCITGQLLLLWLANKLYTKCKTVKVIQVNTDGVMISVDKSERPLVEEICKDFVEKSGITLDTDNIKLVVQRDVNNYIEVQRDGKVKKKGGALVRGLSPIGAFSINNQAPIIAEALEKYLVNGTSISETINNCNDIFKFQLICKASHKYSNAYHEVNGQLVEVQRCNRVYASQDKNLGGLFKLKDNTMAKQCAGTQKLPEHCLIDNNNELTIDRVYKQWYIDVTEIAVMKFKRENEKNIAKAENLFKELREL